jgi:hypothetical protein
MTIFYILDRLSYSDFKVNILVFIENLIISLILSNESCFLFGNSTTIFSIFFINTTLTLILLLTNYGP